MSFLLLKVRSNSDMIRAICKGALRYGSSEVQKGLKSAVQKKCTAPLGEVQFLRVFRLQIGEFWLCWRWIFFFKIVTTCGTALCTPEPPTSDTPPDLAYRQAPAGARGCSEVQK